MPPQRFRWKTFLQFGCFARLLLSVILVGWRTPSPELGAQPCAVLIMSAVASCLTRLEAYRLDEVIDQYLTAPHPIQPQTQIHQSDVVIITYDKAVPNTRTSTSPMKYFTQRYMVHDTWGVFRNYTKCTSMIKRVSVVLVQGLGFGSTLTDPSGVGPRPSCCSRVSLAR